MYTALGIRSIIKTYSVGLNMEERLFQNPNNVATATTNRDAWLVFFFCLPYP